MKDASAADRQPSTLLSIAALCTPPLFLLLACGMYVLLPGGVMRSIEEMGWFSFMLVAAATALGTIATMVFLALAVRGRRIPAAQIVFFAALPWLGGLLATGSEMASVEAAVANADASARAMVMAVGLSQALNARALGCLLASALFAAVAGGLAIAAVAQRAPRRSGKAALLGIVAMLPLLGLAIYVAIPVGSHAASVIVAALAALVAGALGAFGAGSEPRARSGALASAVPIAAGLAVLAATACVASVATMQLFGALGSIEPAARASMIVRAAEELVPANRAFVATLPLALLGAAAIAGWAASRARPSAGTIAGAIALLAVGALVLVSDVLAERARNDVLMDAAALPWSDVDEFRPVALSAGDDWDEPVALVRADGLTDLDGRPIASLDDRDLPSRLTRWKRANDEPGVPLVDPLAVPSDLVVAIDARVRADSLRRLLDAASRAEMRAITFVGTGPQSSTESREWLDEHVPVLVPLLTTRRGVRVVLGASVPAALPEEDEWLVHATVGAAVAREVTTRGDRPRALSGRRPDVEGHPIYLAMAPHATAQSVLATAARAVEYRMTPVLVTGAIPGTPTRLPTPITISGFGPIGRGRPVDVEVELGTPEVRGSLPPASVQRIMQRDLDPVRLCYRHAFETQETKPRGTVELTFIIGPSGVVQSAAVRGRSIRSDELASCVVGAARGWTFPAPEGGAIVGVRCPLTFTPR